MSQPIGIGVSIVQILKRFAIWGLASETLLGGVAFNTLCLSRITYLRKIELAFLVSFLSKGPVLIEVSEYI